MERDFEKKHQNQSPNAFIRSSASHRIFCVGLGRPLSTAFRRMPQIVRGPTEIFCLCRIPGAQQAVKFGEKPQISTFGGHCTQIGGYLDPQNYTTQRFVTDPCYIRKHKLRISHTLRVHMERDLGIFCQVGHLTIFQKFDSKNLELQKLFTRENLIFYTQCGPLSGGQISSEYVCVKKLGRPGNLPENVDFQRLACSGPRSGGTVTPTIKIFHGPVEGHTLYKNCVLVTTTPATFRGYGTPNFDKTSKIRQIPPSPPQ